MAGESSLPLDTSVFVPASVKRASEAADAIHKAAYKDETPNPITPQPDPALAQPQPQPDPQAQPQPQPQPDPQLSQPIDRSGVDPASWEGRYYAMEGRFRQSQVSIGGLQEQLSELGDELIRTQEMMRQPRRQQQPQPQVPAQPTIRRLTDEDVKTYGPELLDTIKRAAIEALSPEIQNLTTQNQRVTQQVTKQGTAGLYQALDREVPDWRAVNVNPRFKNWCRSPDVYSGELRGKLLNAAFHAVDAPRVVAFFKGFLSEEVATGNAPNPQTEPQPDPAPRQAALSLDALAAPGRAKPASGEQPASADKPVFTRGQIAHFYSHVGRQAYAGREADRKRDEAMIFAAQREGRVKG